MADAFAPHATRPVKVWISEPVTTGNRGEVARWLADHGIATGQPAEASPPYTVLLISEQRPGSARELLSVRSGERVLVDGRRVEVLDHAHYALWYEPAPDDEPDPHPDDIE